MKGFVFKLEVAFCLCMLISSAIFLERNDREDESHGRISELRGSLVLVNEDEVTSDVVSEITSEVVSEVAEVENSADELIINEEPKVEKNVIPKEKVIFGFPPDFPTNSILKNYLKSWENSALYRAEMINEYGDEKINEYITTDGVYYKTSFDGALNVGFGIVIRSSGGAVYNEAIFERFGIDCTDLENVETGNLIYRGTVDAVMSDIIESIRNEVIAELSENGVTDLKNYQIDALTAVCYQFGITGGNLDSFAELYKEYGVSPQLKELYFTTGGSKPFMEIPGGTSYDGVTRAQANWALFSEGRVIICRDC